MRTILSRQTGNGRFWWSTALVAALAVGVLLGSSFAPRSAAGAQAPALLFSGEVGLIVNLVNSANTADFERVMTAYGETLVGSGNADRRRMGAAFKLYRASEAGPSNSAIYYSIFDPVISGGDYQHFTILAEEFGGGSPGNGDEVRELYTAYTGALAPGGSQLNLTLVQEY